MYDEWQVHKKWWGIEMGGKVAHTKEKDTRLIEWSFPFLVFQKKVI